MIEMRWSKTGLLARRDSASMKRMHAQSLARDLGRDGILKKIFSVEEAPATVTKANLAKLLIFALLGIFTGLFSLLLTPLFSVTLPALTVAGMLSCISFLMFLTGLVVWKKCK